MEILFALALSPLLSWPSIGTQTTHKYILDKTKNAEKSRPVSCTMSSTSTTTLHPERTYTYTVGVSERVVIIWLFVLR